MMVAPEYYTNSRGEIVMTWDTFRAVSVQAIMTQLRKRKLRRVK